MAHRLRKTWTIWAIGGVLVLLAGAWLVQALSTQSGSDDSKGAAMTTKTLDVRPQLIDTSDALSRYVSSLTTGSSVDVTEANIYYAKNVDWNNDTVVAIKFLLFNAKSITGASIQTVEGEAAYVIDVLDAPQCGSYAQVDTTRVVFIKQSGRDTNLPVIIRTTPNTAKCPDGLQ